MAGFSLGLEGAAFATVLNQLVGRVVPLVYFGRVNSSPLRLVKSKFDDRAILKICTNSASELLNNISMSIVGIPYNLQLLKYAGEDGLASYGVIIYVDFMFVSMFIGYCVGVSPLISYNYGVQNKPELKNLLRKSLVILGISSFIMFTVSELLASAVSNLFVSYDRYLYEMTLRGFRLYSVCFLFAGLSIYLAFFLYRSE